MLARFREHASHIAATLLVAMLALGHASFSPHEDDCHEACAAAVQHDASAHRVTSPAADTDNHPLHCLVCHWARSFRPDAEPRIIPVASVVTTATAAVDSPLVARRAVVAQPPLRSPPSSPKQS